MESFFSRYRNLVVLLAALLLQVMGLAVQVRKTSAEPGHEGQDGSGVRLIRLWSAALVTPFEKAIHGSRDGITWGWQDYIDLRHTRDENKALKQDLDRMRLEQATLIEDARQGHRLQGLLGFRESYIYSTLPAQVIGTSGNLQSHVISIDKGADDGLKVDMAVVTPDGIVGKVREVFAKTAQVLVVNDQTSGAGVVLETTRTRGILRGNAGGEPQVIDILADARIQPGERVLTAGGDQVFPRGLPVGVVARVERDPERGSFIHVIVKPAANLQHLDEVLVITSMDAHLSAQEKADLATSEDLKGAEVAAEAARKKAADEMEQRLPGLHEGADPNAPNAPAATPGAAAGANAKPGDLVKPLPAVPKAIPALHPDRFTPGGGSGRVPNTAEPDANAQPDDANPDASAPAAPKPALKTPQKPPTKPSAPNGGPGGVR